MALIRSYAYQLQSNLLFDIIGIIIVHYFFPLKLSYFFAFYLCASYFLHLILFLYFLIVAGCYYHHHCDPYC